MRIPLYPIKLLLNTRSSNAEYEESSCFSCLDGGKIVSMCLDSTKTILTVEFERTELLQLGYNSSHLVARFEAVGDCCNSVWFESIDGMDTVGTVISTEEKGWNAINEGELGDDGDFEDQGFWTIWTTGGMIDVQVRNSHNGYYGGNVRVLDIEPVGHCND